jgi:hypothetical protein
MKLRLRSSFSLELQSCKAAFERTSAVQCRAEVMVSCVDRMLENTAYQTVQTLPIVLILAEVSVSIIQKIILRNAYLIQNQNSSCLPM